MSHLLSFDLASLGTPEESAPLPDHVVAGEPRHRTWNLETSADGKTFAGVWESSPGTWRTEYEEWEFCTFLTGECILTDGGAEPVRLKAGDSFVIRPGFRGTWEVVETTRKLYVIREP